MKKMTNINFINGLTDLDLEFRVKGYSFGDMFQI